MSKLTLEYKDSDVEDTSRKPAVVSKPKSKVKIGTKFDKSDVSVHDAVASPNGSGARPGLRFENVV